MKTFSRKQACFLMGLGMSFPIAAGAQEKLETSVGADLVSGYIWRGQDCGGVSIQPYISIAKSGFSLTAWGSVGFDKDDTREFDLTLGYNIGGFSVAVTDYYFSGVKYFNYAAHSTSHVYEATIGYDFGPIAISWNTNFAGNDYFKDNFTQRAYSSYFEISAPFRVAGIDFTAEAGATPWEGAYTDGSDKFSVVNVGLKAAKDIRITDSFSIPIFAKATINPRTEGAYFVFGLSF